MEKEYVFRQPTSFEHYKASAFIVRCFDDRFRAAFESFAHELKLTHYDPESVAGGAKIFASPEHESEREFMTRELEKSIKLHHTKKVILFTHEDCGAYGTSSKFEGNAEKEFEFHVDELKKARDYVAEHVPGLQIETYFIDQEGIVKLALVL